MSLVCASADVVKAKGGISWSDKAAVIGWFDSIKGQHLEAAEKRSLDDYSKQGLYSID
jgi:hypothetical protein